MFGKLVIRLVVRIYDWEYVIFESCDLLINKFILIVIIFILVFIKDLVGGKMLFEDFLVRSIIKICLIFLVVVVGNSVVL